MIVDLFVKKKLAKLSAVEKVVESCKEGQRREWNVLKSLHVAVDLCENMKFWQCGP